MPYEDDRHRQARKAVPSQVRAALSSKNILTMDGGHCRLVVGGACMWNVDPLTQSLVSLVDIPTLQFLFMFSLENVSDVSAE